MTASDRLDACVNCQSAVDSSYGACMTHRIELSAEVERLRAEMVSARKEASTALELVDEALMLAESLGPWTDEALDEHMSIESRRRAAAAGTPEGTHDA